MAVRTLNCRIPLAERRDWQLERRARPPVRVNVLPTDTGQMREGSRSKAGRPIEARLPYLIADREGASKEATI